MPPCVILTPSQQVKTAGAKTKTAGHGRFEDRMSDLTCYGGGPQGGWARDSGRGYGRCRFARAVVMIRSISSTSGSPVAAHISGKPEDGVIPGMVLISLSSTSPDGV